MYYIYRFYVSVYAVFLIHMFSTQQIYEIQYKEGLLIIDTQKG